MHLSAETPWTTSPDELCLVSATILQRRDDAVVEVLPGDQTPATTVQGWLEAYATSRDPWLREQIILAYLVALGPGTGEPSANEGVPRLSRR